MGEVKSEELISVNDQPIRKNPRITDDDLYRRSSQYRVWSYTMEALQETKAKAYEKGKLKAIKHINESYNKLKSENPEVFQKYSEELAIERLLDLVTLEEELKYLNFYCKSLIQTANFFKMPTQVRSTAISFFKKFYLVNSVMEYHPKNILYTCVFLAAKSENYFISIDSFCKALPKTDPKDVLDLEFIVLQSLHFTLLVHHPFRPLYGFFLDFQAVLLHPAPVMYDVSVDTLGSLYDKAKKWLNDHALLSDVAFLFTPPQIALAAMYDIDKRITDKYLKRKILKENRQEVEKLETIKEESNDEIDRQEVEESTDSKAQRDQYETLVRTIRKCVKLAKQIPKSSREESINIDKKRFFALNPTKLIKKKISKLTSPSLP